jgi:L-asparagine transporter-like permease
MALFLYPGSAALLLIPVAAIFIALSMFIYYCYSAYQQRIRKHVDEQIKLSLLSVLMLLLPVLLLVIVIVSLISISAEKLNLILSYGFIIFFGWITAIILGIGICQSKRRSTAGCTIWHRSKSNKHDGNGT